MNIVIIVQARMSSSRLPGKVMKEVLGKPLLEYLLERLKRVKQCHAVCVATTTGPQEAPVSDVCTRMSVATFRGSEEDVLGRYYQAARAMQADTVIRVTSDCPLIDPAEIDRLIGYYCEHAGEYDHITDSRERTYPLGMSAEIFSFAALERAHQEAKAEPEREHVTPYMYLHPELFRLGSLTYKENQRDHRWTLDTEEDLQLISRIIESLYPDKPAFTIQDILRLIEQHPEWKDINSHVLQKTLGQ